MNLGSGWLGGGGSGAQALALDYGRLVASLAAVQATSRTAAPEIGSPAAPHAHDPVDALVTLFAAQPGWGGAVAALGGSFNPVVARALTDPAPKAR